MTVGLANVLSGMLGQQWPTLKSLSKLWSCFCFLHFFAWASLWGKPFSPNPRENHGLVKDLHIWVCLKIWYIPNYSHLIGIMISKTIGFRDTLFSDTPIFCTSLGPSNGGISHWQEIWVEVDPCHTICSKAEAKLLSGSKCDVKWLWDKSGINWMV